MELVILSLQILSGLVLQFTKNYLHCTAVFKFYLHAKAKAVVVSGGSFLCEKF